MLEKIWKSNSRIETLESFGLPKFDPSQPSLMALYAGAVYHKIALVEDLINVYSSKIALPEKHPKYSSMLKKCYVDGESPRLTAKKIYREGIRFNRNSSELWFNLGKILYEYGLNHEARIAFSQCLNYPYHERSIIKDGLYANASWNLAEILREKGLYAEALVQYKKSIFIQPHFGAYHEKYVQFLYEIGDVDEFVIESQKLFAYAHAYPSEFMLPKLDDSQCSDNSKIRKFKSLFSTSSGGKIIFFKDRYFEVDDILLNNSNEYIEKILDDTISVDSNCINYDATAKKRIRFNQSIAALI